MRSKEEKTKEEKKRKKRKRGGKHRDLRHVVLSRRAGFSYAQWSLFLGFKSKRYLE